MAVPERMPSFEEETAEPAEVHDGPPAGMGAELAEEQARELRAARLRDEISTLEALHRQTLLRLRDARAELAELSK